MESKPFFFWVIGAALIAFGALIAGQARPDVLGATTASFGIALLVAFIFILLGGLFWITVAGVIHK